VSPGQLTGRAGVNNGSDSDGILDDILEEYAGEGKTLGEALENAYENGKRASGKHLFQLEHIFLQGENPLSGYAVIIRPHG
jgi:hypothetical protein